eukprot:TRINITY_DN71280_c0_g1_i1.p1 TRINITY_DN71280_c0_g1~~TRINITY_DN71280_c0_g1_i1.p1  ORF type:complete len:452 (+),score=35.34 TRINITY_DN71280_c0_g1_i1:156-1358(+)
MVPVKGKGKGRGYAAPSSNTAAPRPELPAGVEFLEIDGSFGEGGGQVLRNTFAYAAVLGKPIRVTKIRNGRPKPGLANQHLTGITAVAELSRGALHGAAVKSTEVEFIPGPDGDPEPRSVLADCGTAGALTLVIQSVLPVLALGSGRTRATTVVTCKGGTDVPFSPPMDYFRYVTLPNLRHFGIDATIDVEARGVMPAGGGIVRVSCSPLSQLTPMRLLDAGKLVAVKVSTLFCGKLISSDIAKEVSAAAAALMRASCNVDVDEAVLPMAPLRASPAKYLSVSVTAMTSTGCVLNGNALHQAKQVSPKLLAEEACQPVIADIERGACLDEHCADQVVIFMALAAGESVCRTGPLTEHTRTAMHFASVCTGAEFSVEPVQEAKKDLYEIRCVGICWRGMGT